MDSKVKKEKRLLGGTQNGPEVEKEKRLLGGTVPPKHSKRPEKKTQNGLKKTQNGPKIEKVKRLLGGTVPPKKMAFAAGFKVITQNGRK